MTISDATVESFEVFDEHGNSLGLVPRREAHRRGLWHRAANVFVFVPDGRLLIQQRQLTKDVCPGAWDVSAAEHLKPGESFAAGAMRGLSEELGIEGATLEPVGEIVRFRLEMPETGLKDYELQQSFLTEYAGPVTPDSSEVMAIRSVRLSDLAAEMKQRPEAFTPWFRQRLSSLRGLLPA